MWLQSEGPPDAMDGGRCVAHSLGHRTQRPMRGAGRRSLQRQADRLGDLVVADLPRRAGPRLIEQPIQSVRRKTAPPFAHRVGIRSNLKANRLVLHPSRRRQDNPGAPGHRLTGLLGPSK